MAAALADWYGPELLLLVTALRPSGAPTPASATHPTNHPAAAPAALPDQQQQQQQSLASLLQASLLPRVAPADELSAASCVRRGLYRSALRVWMAERSLLTTLPLELVRALALTYWQQVGSHRQALVTDCSTHAFGTCEPLAWKRATAFVLSIREIQIAHCQMYALHTFTSHKCQEGNPMLTDIAG
jgi:hypothetical protein